MKNYHQLHKKGQDSGYNLIISPQVFISSFCIQISTYENDGVLAEKDITQEDVLKSIAEVSDIFGKTRFPTYFNKLKSI
jgi:hypothetical protein